jgi:hypothetical protein
MIENDTPSQAENIPGGNSPFDHIVDDTEERAEAREWILRSFREERDPDQMVAELTANGWPSDDAEAMVEEGRKATRQLRGVVTREDVVRASEARYRGSFSNIAARFGMGGMLLVGIHFLLSFTSFRRSPWPRGQQKHHEEDQV